MDKVIKIVLAILLFICLLDMPYGFYQVVRFVALIGFAILAYPDPGILPSDRINFYVALQLKL